MSSKAIRIIDEGGETVATAQVSERGVRLGGQIDLSSMPTRLRRKFEEYEEIVNGQMFSLLDEIEDQIRALRLKVAFEDGSEAPVEDLQIYPSTRRVSFRMAERSVRSAARAASR
jgi:hypothetical protein